MKNWIYWRVNGDYLYTYVNAFKSQIRKQNLEKMLEELNMVYDATGKLKIQLEKDIAEFKRMN